MLDALKRTLGIVSSAAEQANITRATHYNWMKNDEEYAESVREIEESAIDFAESKLLESIDNGSDTATIFYLKTKGKNRGYVERTETTVTQLPAPIIEMPNE